MAKQEPVVEPQDNDAFERFKEIARKVLTATPEAYREFAEREKRESFLGSVARWRKGVVRQPYE